MMTLMLALCLTLVPSVLHAQTTCVGIDQANDAAVCGWRFYLYPTAGPVPLCPFGAAWQVPKTSAIRLPTPGHYRACLPSWFSPQQRQLRAAAYACTDSAVVSGLSNPMPTRTPTP